ncbi:23783_t:CDS:2, partial [Racocetra persica]
LDLSHNNITKLDVSDCYDLEKIIFAHNSLTRLLNHPRDFVNPEKLTYLNIMNNNITKIDLSFFNRFINLETLFIGTDDREKIEQGLIHLPDSLKEFFYEVYRPEAKVMKIKKKLEPFEGNVKKYKEDKSRKVPNKKLAENIELEE